MKNIQKFKEILTRRHVTAAETLATVESRSISPIKSKLSMMSGFSNNPTPSVRNEPLIQIEPEEDDFKKSKGSSDFGTVTPDKFSLPVKPTAEIIIEPPVETIIPIEDSLIVVDKEPEFDFGVQHNQDLEVESIVDFGFFDFEPKRTGEEAENLSDDQSSRQMRFATPNEPAIHRTQDPWAESINKDDLIEESLEVDIIEPFVIQKSQELVIIEPEVAIIEPVLIQESQELVIIEPEVAIIEPVLIQESPEVAIIEPEVAIIKPVLIREITSIPSSKLMMALERADERSLDYELEVVPFEVEESPIAESRLKSAFKSAD
jgi:hypothetical protein